MKKIKDMTYFMEASMHAFPRYSAILVALALMVPAAFAQEVEDLDVAIEEETPIVETIEADEENEAVADVADEAEADIEAEADGEADGEAEPEVGR